MKIASISLNQIWENKHENMKKCAFYLKQAAALESNIVIFPEMTLTGFSMNSREIAESIECSETIDFFKGLAINNLITIIFGMVLHSTSKPTNNLLVISSAGRILANYAKIHPFTFSSEDNYYSKGNELTQCLINDTNFGITICYDLSFPEIFQALSKQSEIIINIANWPKVRIDHWKTLLKARAIENQSVCIGVNRTGVDGNGVQYERSSVVFDQCGIQIIPSFSEAKLDIFDINTNEITEERNRFPVKNDRRTKLYKEVI